MKKIFLYCLLCFAFMLNHAQTPNYTIESTQNSNTTTPSIDKLLNNEQYTIHFSSVGCFHNRTEIMTFVKENNAYYVVYNKEKKKLDGKSIQKIRKFEKELFLQQDAGCTTIDKYVVTYNESQQTILDGSCSWRGYSKLKKELGLS